MQNVGVTGRYVRKPVVRCMVTTFKDQWHSTLRAGSKVVVIAHAAGKAAVASTK